MSVVPSGFAPHDRPSPVTDAWQPLFSRMDDACCVIGFELATQHCNGRGLLHGGVIAALADNAMGISLGLKTAQDRQQVLEKNSKVSGIVTTSLAVDYVGMARVGAWIEIMPRVVSASEKSGIVDAIITADGRTIARANASFRILTELAKP